MERHVHRIQRSVGLILATIAAAAITNDRSVFEAIYALLEQRKLLLLLIVIGECQADNGSHLEETGRPTDPPPRDCYAPSRIYASSSSSSFLLIGSFRKDLFFFSDQLRDRADQSAE